MSYQATSQMQHARYPRLLVAGLLFLSASSFFSLDAEQRMIKPTLVPGKTLIIYLSRTNNTKAVAGYIQQATGGTLIALELATPYPKNYAAAVQQVARENEQGYAPPLRTSIKNIQQYDVVFVGFPTWGMQLPPPIRSFLQQYDLRGKTIVPFNTHAGYGVGSGFETIKALVPQSTVLEGFSTHGGVERDGVLSVMEGPKAKQVQAEVNAWLSKLKLLNSR